MSYHVHIKSDGQRTALHFVNGIGSRKTNLTYTINQTNGRCWQLRSGDGVVVKEFNRVSKMKAIRGALCLIEGVVEPKKKRAPRIPVLVAGPTPEQVAQVISMLPNLATIATTPAEPPF